MRPVPARSLWSLALVAGLAVAAYHNTLWNLFVLDDYHFVLQNPTLSLSAAPSYFWHAYVSAGVEYYRPLSVTTFALDRAVFGPHAIGYHAHNVLWHAAACVALWAVLTRCFDTRAATAGALLFAVHPIHTEAVAGVVGRMELMAGCFTLLCVRAQLDGRRFAAAAMALLAVWSKESGIVAPALAILLDAWRRRDAKRALLDGLGLLVPLGMYGVLRVHALSGTPGALPAPSGYFLVTSWTRGWLTAVDCLGRYLGLLLWPHPLSADYSYPALPISTGLNSPRTLLTVGGLLVLGLGSFVLRRRAGWLSVAVLAFFIAILPVSNLVVRINVLLAERVLYIPSVSIALLAAGLWQGLGPSLRPGVRRGALAALVLAGLAATMARNTDWETPLTLWTDTVEKVPRSGLAHGNLALACATALKWDCAEREIRTAIELNPGVSHYVEARALIDRKAEEARTGRSDR